MCHLQDQYSIYVTSLRFPSRSNLNKSDHIKISKGDDTKVNKRAQSAYKGPQLGGIPQQLEPNNSYL